MSGTLGQLTPAEVLGSTWAASTGSSCLLTAVRIVVASGVQAARRHPRLALEHGIAVHRASLDWARSTMAALAQPDPVPVDNPRSGHQANPGADPGRDV